MKFLVYILSIILLVMVIGSSCKKKQEYLNNNVTPNNFLSNNKYSRLIIEIDYVTGYEPTDAAVQKVVSFLTERINKSDGIVVRKSAIASGTGSAYNLTDIRNIEKYKRQEVTKGSTITAYVLFLDKDYSENANTQSKVLGINYEQSSIVIFENAIRNISGEVLQPSTEDLETTVFEHEFGHVLGLTNNGTTMQNFHQDTEHGAHCNTQSCLMHYAVETNNVVANLLENGIPQLDRNCLDDLKANGGK